MKSSDWLLLLHALPARRNTQRVGLWRNLKKLGALPLKTSASLLPDTPAHHERFQWLAQQIRDGGGDATLIRTHEIEGLTERQIQTLFNEQRTPDYAALCKALTTLLKANQRQATDSFAPALEKLRGRLAEIQPLDFFDCPKKQDALMLFQKAERLHQPRQKPAMPLKRAAYCGRTWLTRPHPQIDRVGSGWLIRTFIDPQAKFVFAPKPKDFPEALPYDMLDVEFTHHGDDCTFETLLKRFALADKTLRRIAEMIHYSDLHDGKYPTAVEAEGIDRVLKGLAQLDWSDDKIFQHGFICFDALYAQMKEQ